MGQGAFGAGMAAGVVAGMAVTALAPGLGLVGFEAAQALFAVGALPAVYVAQASATRSIFAHRKAGEKAAQTDVVSRWCVRDTSSYSTDIPLVQTAFGAQALPSSFLAPAFNASGRGGRSQSGL